MKLPWMTRRAEEAAPMKRALFTGGPRGDEAREVSDSLPATLVLAIPPERTSSPPDADGYIHPYRDSVGAPFETYERVEDYPVAQLLMRGFDACYRYRR